MQRRGALSVLVRSTVKTLMIDIPGGLVRGLPCMQQASYLEGGPLMWMLPLYLHDNQNSYYDMIDKCSLGDPLPKLLKLFRPAEENGCQS